MNTREFGKQGWIPGRLDSLTEKIYFITGANAGGAGFEAKRILLIKGAEVV